MLQVGFQLLDFVLDIDKLIKRHAVFGRTHNEGSTASCFLADTINDLAVGEFLNKRTRCRGSCGCRIECEHLFLRYILARTDITHIRYNQFQSFYIRKQCLVSRAELAQCSNHNALAGLTFGQVLPQFLRDERHEGVKQAKHLVEE